MVLVVHVVVYVSLYQSHSYRGLNMGVQMYFNIVEQGKGICALSNKFDILH